MNLSYWDVHVWVIRQELQLCKSLSLILWQSICTLFTSVYSTAEFNRRQLSLRPELESSSMYTEELESLQKMLHFPEEVALMLTQTEHKLFNSVPPAHYIRQVTLELSLRASSGSQPTVRDLIQRFSEVWTLGYHDNSNITRYLGSTNVVHWQSSIKDKETKDLFEKKNTILVSVICTDMIVI